MEQDFSTLKQRILEYAEFKGFSKRKIYIDTGIANGTLDKKSGLTELNIEKFISTYQDISVKWFITGKGSMLKEEKSFNIQRMDQSRKTTDQSLEYQEVPLYDIQAVAGLQELFDTGKPAQVLDTIHIPNLPRCDGAITITGDSMYPLLKSGDIILYAITSVENIFYGEMYLLGIQLNDFEEFVTVKYIHRSAKKDFIKLVSQNVHHDDKEIPINSIRSIALVKASIRFNTMS